MTKSKSIADSIRELKGGVSSDSHVVKPSKNQKENKPPRIAKSTNDIDRRHFNGGTHVRGRREGERIETVEEQVKKTLYQLMEDHMQEEIPVTMIIDGKQVNTKRARMLIQMQRLYDHGKDKYQAVEGWLDRAVGKAMQPIEHRGDKDKPLRLIVDL